MPNIVWPTAHTKEVTDSIREAIGRTISFFVVASSIPCTASGCNLDPVTNTSTNSFCTVCSGEYWIPVYQETQLTAHVTWGYSERLGWVSGGQLDEGECRVQIEYTPANEQIVRDAKYLIVDGRTMEKVKPLYRGVKTINRILIDLQEKEYN